MINEKEIAKLIYEGLKQNTPEKVTNLISRELKEEKTKKLNFTKTPLLNAIGRELGKLIKDNDQLLDALLKVWKNGEREEKLISISAIGVVAKREYQKIRQLILKILADINNWEICDQLALRVISVLAVENKKEIFSLMKEWVSSENKWLRRLAVATIPPFIRAKKSEAEICLQLLEPVMADKDRDVKKAVGWALREISKKDPESVYNFLTKWAKNKEKNTASIIKDGMKKLPENLQGELLKQLK